MCALQAQITLLYMACMQVCDRMAVYNSLVNKFAVLLKVNSIFDHLHQKGLAHPPPDDVVYFFISRHALIGLCEYKVRLALEDML